MSSISKRTIALAGAGDLAKYLVEELLAAKYNIVVLSRSERPWFSDHSSVSLQITNYSKESILSILNDSNAEVLFSFLHSNDPEFYVGVHKAMLEACKQSKGCKRFVPSEYGGDIEAFPNLPRFYEPTHGAFRDVLEKEGEGVEWTLVNIGWFMDYFVQPGKGGKSDMKALPEVWPIDLDNWAVEVLGTGEEMIGWTSARDVAKALARLVGVEKGEWERRIYVCGERGTWNEAIDKLEKHHGINNLLHVGMD
jgi:nucleoside-diphosphate-sugar epimerase